MKNRKSILWVASAILLFVPGSIAGQTLKKQPASAPSALGTHASSVQKAKAARIARWQRPYPGTVEPLRVIGGELHANIIKGQVRRAGVVTAFSFMLRKAEIASGRLQISGDVALDGAPPGTRDQVVATVGGVMSNAANPWPSARQSYAQSGPTTACGVLFLKLTLAQRLRARIGATSEPLQLGVVLKPFDNQRGEEIVRQICLLQKPESPNQSANLNELNRLLVFSK